jgi:hypothetical protein
MAAEAASSAMLGARFMMNMIERFDCQFKYDGSGELDMDSCRNMENATEWMMTKGKNFNKDVLKKMINVMLAIDSAVNGTALDPRSQMRRVLPQDDMPDFGDLQDWVIKVMPVLEM